MGYAAALLKAWEDLAKSEPQGELAVKFLAEEYAVDLSTQKVVSASGNAPAREFIAVLILHYLVKKLAGLPALTGEWAAFKELSGVEGYEAAFRQRVIAPILSKYGSNPRDILAVTERLPAKRVNQGDIGLIIEVFTGVPVLITLWRQDEEFPAEANLLFDRNIRKIFCTEDIVVLAGMVAGAL